MSLLQLNPTISVYAKLHGDAECLVIIDNGPDCNSIWLCKLDGGIIKHFWSDDIRVYGNPIDGAGWDIDIPEDWKPKNKL